MITQAPNRSFAIGMILFPNLTLLNFTAAYEVFSRLPSAKVYLLAPTLDPVYTESGFCLLPNTSFERSPALDVLFVPGGLGVNAKLEDNAFLHFLKTQGDRALYVTSVCTGSLLLAAAGLLPGYRATTHWFAMDLLAMFGVEVVAERVVIDRNRITGAGVTAALDFGLVLATKLYGEKVAQEIQLSLEYAPTPIFQCGSPQTASFEIVENARVEGRSIWETQRRTIQRSLDLS